MSNEIKLRPYQEKALAGVRAAFSGNEHPDVTYKKGHSGPAKSVLLVMPCRSGKTYTFSAIAKGAADKGNNVNIMAHRKELIFQASNSLASLGVFHRLIAPNNKRSALIKVHNEKFLRPYIRSDSHVTMSSIQTLTRRIEWLDEFKPALHIADEAHRSLSISYTRVFESSPYARLLGVTATPCRTDGRGLGDIYDAMVIGPTHEELQALGNILPCKVFAPPLSVDLSGVGTKQGDLDADQMAEILDKPAITDDAVKRYLANTPGEPGIVYCCNRKHAKHVAAQFQEAGVKAFVIDGTMDDSTRDRLINGQANGTVELLVSVDLISEGTDLVCAAVAILLRKTQSLALYIQQTNRVLTPDPDNNKEFGVIHDHVGNVYEFGMPDAYREWSLEGGKRKPKSTNDEPDIKVTRCPECYHAHEKSEICPECGYKYETKIWKPPITSDDELEEIGDFEAKQEILKKRREQGKARDLQSLVRQGMSESRAKHILQARAEKKMLQDDLKRACDEYVNHGGAVSAIGFSASEILKMKPKQLRAEIDRIGKLEWERA